MDSQSIVKSPKDNTKHHLCSRARRSIGPTIIYVWRRYEAEVLAEYLQAAGLKATAYHAGMESQQRLRTQELFMRGSFDIVVATVAFGMGVDKANVRCVMHTTAPKSIENYIQEIGRAGRDGDVSNCLLILDKNDMIQQYSLSFTNRVATYQIYLMITIVFEKVYHRLKALLSSESYSDERCLDYSKWMISKLSETLSSSILTSSDDALRVSVSQSQIKTCTDLPGELSSQK